MSELITKVDGTPYATLEAAKSKRTRMGVEGMDTNIVKVDGGFALENKPYIKPKKRIPLGKRNVLTIQAKDKDPNYSYRIVNDKDGRINMFRDAGWEVVEKPGGLQVGDPDIGTAGQVGSIVTKPVGGGMVGYLMRIPKEFYKEDQKAKANKIDEGEAGLKLEETKKGRYGSAGVKKKREY
jgi:hypothetical protein